MQEFFGTVAPLLGVMDYQEADASNELEFVLAGGCFWCQDAIYRKVEGVTFVESGYTGGTLPNPSYEAVCTGTTGHAEAVKVRFDPNVVPADVILDIFFTSHDPTTLNRQGNDVGPQYRSAMFPADQQQRDMFERSITRAQENWDDPIVTAIEPETTWYPAEDMHQDFYSKRPDVGYCQVIINPKLAGVRKHYSAWLTA